ncbi:protein 3 [Vitis varicosavirus]|uniref:Protein 3 n=1 Tax=Vitis varicosavirus TaxID=2812030 RepID=A0A830ZZU5_9RHAB|nr:protein 3 [Vitis varicosavirus]BCS90311.1 protein 3 [Vitis varicosavirus]
MKTTFKFQSNFQTQEGGMATFLSRSNSARPSRTITNDGQNPIAFTGVSRRIDGGPEGGLTRPLDPEERYVLDTFAPRSAPRKNMIYSRRWLRYPRGAEGEINLGEVGLKDRFLRLQWGSNGSIVGPEIHVIYLPHLPSSVYRENSMEISLIFIGDGEDTGKLLSKAIFPSPQHMHVIFHPGHSFSLTKGSKFPWMIKLDTTADIRDDYMIADIVIQFRGYNTPLSTFSDRSGATLIALVPSSEFPTGITLTRPRGDKDWIVGGIHYGINGKKDVKEIALIQEAGIDIEGLQVLGKLKGAILSVGKLIGNKEGEGMTDQIHKDVRALIMGMLSST